MNLTKLISPFLLVFAACFSGMSFPASEYGDSMAPVPIMEAASSLATDWTATLGGGSSSYSSGSSFTATMRHGGAFTCEPGDIEVLAADLKLAFEDDIFGVGFQLVGLGAVKVGTAAGPVHVAIIMIEFQDQVESGTLRIELDPTAVANEFEYKLSVMEESR